MCTRDFETGLNIQENVDWMLERGYIKKCGCHTINGKTFDDPDAIIVDDYMVDRNNCTLPKMFTIYGEGYGKIVLPKTAELKDATNAISASDGSDKSVAGKITYTYAGHEVGGANLLYTENSIKKYPFHNVAPEDGGSKVKYYRVDFRLIIGLILLILVILFFHQWHIHTDISMFYD